MERPLQISYTFKGSCFAKICYFLFSQPPNTSKRKIKKDYGHFLKDCISCCMELGISWYSSNRSKLFASCTSKGNFTRKESDADLKRYWRWCSADIYDGDSSIGEEHKWLAIVKAYQTLISYPLCVYSTFTPNRWETTHVLSWRLYLMLCNTGQDYCNRAEWLDSTPLRQKMREFLIADVSWRMLGAGATGQCDEAFWYFLTGALWS